MTYASNDVSKYTLTQEKVDAIKQFWPSVQQDSFQTADGVTIAYAANFSRADQPYIVIVPGRSESYLKYQELIYDLDQQGYDSVVIDHRGQGLSTRLTRNRLQGYVAQFDHYAQDLQQLLAQVLPAKYPAHHQQSFMLAHSMGGAIALRYLQLYPNQVKAVSLTSPMIAIKSAGLPIAVAKFFVKMGNQLNQWLSDTPWYFIGQSDNNSTSFADNRLMHSAERYQRFQNLYQQQPELKLGGVTFHWLAQAIDTNDKLFMALDKLSMPIQVLQAGDEVIVDNAAQDAFCQQLHAMYPHSCPDGKAITLAGAYHELLFEADQYRDITLAASLAWFAQHQ
ncbi:lysophospholipase [Colwellia chukchiensis]|uniref:Lysophospholipase n=1 Tax=Colwellia chukchiensis TaxID=641665 RepID=A0A1H7T7Q9_9GAMM|nr:lysophospholipase [Colwellia chukchiensis]